MTSNDTERGWAPHDPEATIRADMASFTAADPQRPAYAPPSSLAAPSAPATPVTPAAPAAPGYVPPAPMQAQPAAPLVAPTYAPPTQGSPQAPPSFGQLGQFGQPGQPAPGQPVWNGSQSRPIAPVTNSSAAKVVATSVLRSLLIRAASFGVVAAIGLGGYYFFDVRKDASAVKAALPAAGQCFSWTDAAGAKVLPCSDALALYKTEATSTASDTVSQQACDAAGSYRNFSVTAEARHDSQTGAICGVLNLRTGDCVTQGFEAMVIPCAGASGAADDEKVLSINAVATAADANSDDVAMKTCGDDADSYLSDNVAPAVICLVKP